MRNIPDYLSDAMSKTYAAATIIEDEAPYIENHDVARLMECYEELQEAIGKFVDYHEKSMQMYADKLAELGDDPDVW